MSSSSISSPFEGVELSWVSWCPLIVGATKSKDLPSGDLPPAEQDMVVRDHGVPDPAAAFCKESMRRDAMTGAKIEHALQDASWYQSNGRFWRRGKRELTIPAGAELPPIHTQMMSTTRLTTPGRITMSPTGARNRNSWNINWLANNIMK